MLHVVQLDEESARVAQSVGTVTKDASSKVMLNGNDPKHGATSLVGN